jgi:squalene-hopene cyclase-like protein/prenyltransferase/squalene oxidase-like repeat protein
VKLLAVAALVGLFAASPVEAPARYVEGRQAPGGGFAEPGSQATPGLTAWAVLGLRAAGRAPASLEASRAYLERTEPQLTAATDLELALLARAALGERPATLVARVRALERPSGAIGPTVNSTIWGVLALRAAGEPAPGAATRYLLSAQTRSGGWSWTRGSEPDSNDTAAAIQALKSANAAKAPIRRAVAFLRRFQNRDGGFELTEGRGSDVQSTAWAIQALVAAGERPPPSAFAYLARMRRPDGSYRYSAAYAVTPVWVTAQALAALARKPLPIR